MGKYYKIVLVKKTSKKDGAEQYRNLTTDFRFMDITKWFKASPKIETLNHHKMKLFVEKMIREKAKGKLNQKYDYSEKEKVEIVSQGENNPSIYKGKVKIPEKLRKGDDSSFGDMK